METMIRMSLTIERMGRMSRTPFPRGLSAEITIISASERGKDDFTALLESCPHKSKLESKLRMPKFN